MDNIELSIKYNLTWEKPYAYDPMLIAVLANGDVIFRNSDWITSRTVAGLLNNAFNMGKMAGLLEAQNYKDVRKDIDAIVAALND